MTKLRFSRKFEEIKTYFPIFEFHELIYTTETKIVCDMLTLSNSYSVVTFFFFQLYILARGRCKLLAFKRTNTDPYSNELNLNQNMCCFQLINFGRGCLKHFTKGVTSKMACREKIMHLFFSCKTFSLIQKDILF